MAAAARHPSTFRRVALGLGVLTAVLLAGATVAAFLSLGKTEEIVAGDLSRQQLILARSVARQTADGLRQVRRELAMLDFSPAVQYVEPVAWVNRMRASMEELARLGAVDLRRYAADGKTLFALDESGHPRTEIGDLAGDPVLAWARDVGSRGRVYHGPVEVLERRGRRVPMMTLAMPVYLVSVDDAHPTAPGVFDGALAVVVELDRLVGRYASDINGEQGYAWVISDTGHFLYHPVEDFVGEGAFTARQRRDPTISFERVNEIQRSKMLRGEEGISWYTSGWHLGLVGKMKKHVAYSPVEVEPGRFWSVAVAAPASVIGHTVRSLYVRQFGVLAALVLSLVLVAAAVLWQERRFSAALEVMVDRTTADLQRSNAELRESEEKYREVVENARDFILIVGRDGDIQAANRFTAASLGVRGAQLVGARLDEVLGERALPILTSVRQALERGRSVEAHHEVQVRGRQYRLSCHFVPLPDGGAPERVLVIARDLIDRQRIEQLMFQTEKLASLGQLAAGVAHEINNPVAVILGFTELLLEKAQEGSEERDVLERMERQGLHCKKIVENLLAFARVPREVDERADANQVVRQVLEMVDATLRSSRVQVELSLEDALPAVRADSTELTQVLLNIAANAVAAMPGGGRLSVATRVDQDSGMVQISLADTGTGIAREHANRVFEPFFTTKKAGEGTGLGLAVSHAIVSKFGGSLSFETRCAAEGQEPSGTTFFVALPMAGEETAHAG